MGLSSFILSFLSWASYLVLVRVPSFRRSMWPLWLFFLISVLLAGLDLASPQRVIEWDIATLISFGLFILAFFTVMRVPQASGRPQTGEMLPALELSDENGQKISPSSFSGKGPLLLVFYRGFW